MLISVDKMAKLNNDRALIYMYGKNAEFTIENTETENKFLYRIVRCKDRDDLFFVRCKKIKGKVDKTNNDHMVYAGYVVRSNNDYKFYKGTNGCLSKDSMAIKALIYTSKHLQKKNLNECVVIKHTGRCAFCGRLLTDEKSIERGYGTYCYEHYVKNKRWY